MRDERISHIFLANFGTHSPYVCLKILYHIFSGAKFRFCDFIHRIPKIHSDTTSSTMQPPDTRALAEKSDGMCNPIKVLTGILYTMLIDFNKCFESSLAAQNGTATYLSAVLSRAWHVAAPHPTPYLPPTMMRSMTTLCAAHHYPALPSPPALQLTRR